METAPLIVENHHEESNGKMGIKRKVQRCLSKVKCSGNLVPVRYEIAIVTSLGFLISFALRCNLGASVVAMTRNHTRFYSDGTTKYVESPEFNWSSPVIGLVDSSFFWGYLITQIPGGFLAMTYPANHVFGFALGFSAFLNLFIPAAAKVHYGLVMALRIVQGLAEGVTYPAAHGIWRWWAPPLERSILSTITFTGSYAGVALGIPLSGVITEAFGWQVSFYIFGVAGILWSIYWWYISYERPDTHPTISEEERHYIEENLTQDNVMTARTWANLPWVSFFTSMPVWAIVVANFCRSWSFYLFVDTQAKYFLEALGYNIGKNWIAAALPHICMAVIVPIGGRIADYLRRHYLSTTVVRKLMNCGGFGMEGIFLIVVAFTTNPMIAIAALCVAVGFSGFAISGFNVNHLDIAPRYASVLMGISNGVGTLAGIFCPIVVGIVTRDGKRSQWTIIFLITGIIHIVGVIFYGIFASGTKQSWADPLSRTNDDEEAKLIDMPNETKKPKSTT